MTGSFIKGKTVFMSDFSTFVEQGIMVERVADLYARFKAMNDPDYYDEGEENPYLRLTKIIPPTARYYTIVHESSRQLLHARLIMKSVSKRRKVNERLCEKHEINFRAFSQAGKLILIWV